MTEQAFLDNPTGGAVDIVAQAQSALADLQRVKAEIGKIVFGQDVVVEQALACILAGGHGLLVGAPGLAKTRLVETIAHVLGLDWARVQFTPDLMPGDILGAEVLDLDEAGKRAFRFIKGPIFAQMLMADEINRASPRTQSALLQAMQEREVTIAGHSYALPRPFHVLATQNPIEQEGTYPLPEAQLDRFLLQIAVDYPDLATERRILLETTGSSQAQAAQVLTPQRLEAIQHLVRLMPVSDAVLEAVLRLVRAARPGPEAHAALREWIAWGPGPRAGQALLTTAKARALLRGRLAPSLDDVEALAPAALSHRIGLDYAARAQGKSAEGLVATLLAQKG